jgi:hypothetical protein
LYLETGLRLVAEKSISAQVPEADPDKGLVVFYRAANFKGGAIRFNVQHADGVIGTLTNGSFFCKCLEPGQHTSGLKSFLKTPSR